MLNRATPKFRHKYVIIIFMDTETRARRQQIKLIISETLMFVSVIITAVILAFLASGYWINSDFEVQRQGMLQIHSLPTGADVEIDGETAWLQRTNTSKVLSSGDHHIVLTKENYDSWEKTVTISEGLLYRINYPRLFLVERESELYYDAKPYTTALASPNHNYLLLGDGTASYTVLRLNSDRPETIDFNLTTLKSTDSNADYSSAELFADFLPVLEWDDTHLIATVNEKHYKINWRNSEIILIPEKEPSEEEPKLPGKNFRFYDEEYGAVIEENTIKLYKRNQREPEIVFETSLDFIPSITKISDSGAFVFMNTAEKIAVLDLEIMKLTEWTLDSTDYGWLDSNMLYSIKDGSLIVYDYDGANRRELSTGLMANLPVTITEDKWLYYSNVNGEIIREIIAR